MPDTEHDRGATDTVSPPRRVTFGRRLLEALRRAFVGRAVAGVPCSHLSLARPGGERATAPPGPTLLRAIRAGVLD